MLFDWINICSLNPFFDLNGFLNYLLIILFPLVLVLVLLFNLMNTYQDNKSGKMINRALEHSIVGNSNVETEKEEKENSRDQMNPMKMSSEIIKGIWGI